MDLSGGAPYLRDDLRSVIADGTGRPGAGLAAFALDIRDATAHTELVISSVVFTTAAAVIAALPGALFGAYQDPAVTLRVP